MTSMPCRFINSRFALVWAILTTVMLETALIWRVVRTPDAWGQKKSDEL